MKRLLAVAVLASGAWAQEPVFKEAVAASTGEGAPHAPGIIDINSDGRPDVATTQATPAGINLFISDAKGGLTGNHNAMLQTRMSPYWGMAANIDGDAFIDYLMMDPNSSSLFVYKGSKGKLGGPSEQNLNIGYVTSACPCDINGDRRPDLVVVGWPDPVVEKTGGRMKVLLGPTLKEVQSIDMVEMGDIAVGDVTGDRKLDAVTVDVKTCEILIFAGDGRGPLSKTPTKVKMDDKATDLKPKDVTLADLDGDKMLDLVIACEGKAFSRIMKGDGKGGFSKKEDLVVALDARWTALGDFNGDTSPDLAVGSTKIRTPYTFNIDVWTGDGKGVFTKNCQLTGEGYFHFYGFAVGDMDLDKKDDLVVATIGPKEGFGNIRRFLTKK